MAGVLQKAMVWLGLAPDDEYDDYPYEGSGRGGAAPRSGAGAPPGYGQAPERRAPAGAPSRPGRPQPRPMPDYEPEPDAPRSAAGRPSGMVRQLPPQGALQNDPRSSRIEETPTVRPMRPTSARPSVLEPTSFDDAKEIADRFKADQPVVMDLSGLERDLSRRLIDFASGICYALGGHMERVRPGGYLLTPASVDVSEDDKRRLRGG